MPQLETFDGDINTKYNFTSTIVFNLINPGVPVINVVSNSAIALTMPPGIQEWYILGFSICWEMWDVGSGIYYNRYSPEAWQRTYLFETSNRDLGELPVYHASLHHRRLYVRSFQYNNFRDAPVYVPTPTITVYSSFLLQSFVPVGALRYLYGFTLSIGLRDKEKGALFTDKAVSFDMSEE